MEGLVAVAHLLHDQRLRVVHLRRPPLELAPRQVGVAQRVALAEVREAVGHRAGAVLVEAPAALEVRFADALLGLERLEVRRRAARTELRRRRRRRRRLRRRARRRHRLQPARRRRPLGRALRRARRARRARRVEGEGARRIKAARAEVVGEAARDARLLRRVGAHARAERLPVEGAVEVELGEVGRRRLEPRLPHHLPQLRARHDALEARVRRREAVAQHVRLVLQAAALEAVVRLPHVLVPRVARRARALQQRRQLARAGLRAGLRQVRAARRADRRPARRAPVALQPARRVEVVDGALVELAVGDN